jgi:hypothetical protein
MAVAEDVLELRGSHGCGRLLCGELALECPVVAADPGDPRPTGLRGHVAEPEDIGVPGAEGLFGRCQRGPSPLSAAGSATAQTDR